MSSSDFKYPCATGSVCRRAEMSVLWVMFLRTFWSVSTPRTERKTDRHTDRSYPTWTNHTTSSTVPLKCLSTKTRSFQFSVCCHCWRGQLICSTVWLKCHVELPTAGESIWCGSEKHGLLGSPWQCWDLLPWRDRLFVASLHMLCWISHPCLLCANVNRCSSNLSLQQELISKNYMLMELCSRK